MNFKLRCIELTFLENLAVQKEEQSDWILWQTVFQMSSLPLASDVKLTLMTGVSCMFKFYLLGNQWDGVWRWKYGNMIMTLVGMILILILIKKLLGDYSVSFAGVCTE